MNGASNRTRTCNQRIMLTTIAFATSIAVCSLDYTFTIAYALGTPRLVSTPSK